MTDDATRFGEHDEDRHNPMTVARGTRPLLMAALTTFFGLILVAPSIWANDPLDLPSPLAGPGVAAVKKKQIRKIQRGWREFVAGDMDEATKRATRAGEVPPAQLLVYQIRLSRGDDGTKDELADFCDRHPEYAAAWMTLSVAEEIVGLESAALEAARRGAALWPEPPWGDRAADLYRHWVDDRVVTAETLFDTGQNSAALAELVAANALDPNRPDMVLLAAEIFVSEGRLDEAATLLDRIPDEPDARFLAGQIAEAGGDWQSAMDLYASLADDYPGKNGALERAQTRWRLTLLPKYAHASMATDQLTRGDLAIVLVSVQPRLETLPGGAVPVMSDIVDYPGQREIITVVRLGIMDADRRGHRFFPNRPVSIDTIHEAIQRSRALLGRTAPVWCSGEDMLGSGCTSIPSPPSGGAVINAVLDSMSGVDP